MSSQKSSGEPSFSLLLFYLSLIVNHSSLDMSPDLCEVVSAVSIGEADARIIDLINVYIACAMDDLCWTNQYADMRYAGSLRILVQLDWRSRTSHSSPKSNCVACSATWDGSSRTGVTGQ